MRKRVFILAVFIFLGFVSVARTEVIRLPEPARKGGVSLEESIQNRRSVRRFLNKDLSLEQIGQLLWSVQGITGDSGHRSAPSAGATYPLEIYAATRDGLYHYMPQSHALEVIATKDVRRDLSLASFGQTSVSDAGVDIIICAQYSRTAALYKDRAERYVHMEVGHAAENLHLQAVVLGLVSVPIGSFDDAIIKKICRLPQDYEPLYIVPVGYAA